MVRVVAPSLTFTRFGAVAVGAVGLLAACTSSELDAPAPVANSARVSQAPLTPLPQSVIDAPIAFSMENALAALERAVPRQFGDIEKRIANPNNKRQHFAFAASRSPFEVKLNGQRLTVETIIDYSGRGWYDPPLAPTVSASCGTGDTRPRVRVVLSTNLSLTSNWRIRTSTRLDTVAPYSTDTRDECRVTLFAVDVTPRVVHAVEGVLRKQLPQVDARLASFDVRTPLERWYNHLNKQIRITDSLWLVFNPSDVHYGGMRFEDSNIVADIRLFARPVVYSGQQPARVITSLPPLVRAPRRVGDTLRVLVDGRLEYDVATAMLQKAIGGKRFMRLGRSVKVDSVKMYGLGDGRVVLAVDFVGALNGKAYLVGTPQIDRASHMLTVPDLNFDVATDNALAQGVAWMKREDVVEELRKRARVPLDEVVDKYREKVENAINRDLTKGVQLTGDLRTGRIIEVVALEREIMIRSEITGSLGLNIDREIPVRKPRAVVAKSNATTDSSAEQVAKALERARKDSISRARKDSVARASAARGSAAIH